MFQFVHRQGVIRKELAQDLAALTPSGPALDSMRRNRTTVTVDLTDIEVSVWAANRLADMGINVTRSQVGNFFTSLEMAGASLTVMRLDDELTELYDAPMHTAGWRAGM